MITRLLAWMTILLIGLNFIARPGEVGAAAPARQKPDYSQFVTLDAIGHFFNEHGPFVGYGVHYNQILNGNHYYEVMDYNLNLMAADLDALYARGMTNVTLRIFWGVYANPATRTTVLAKWDAVFNLIEAHGMYATIWFDPANSWPRPQIPDDQRYDTAVRDYNWNLFLDHVRDFTARYKDRKCIIGYNVNNEAVATIHYETLNAQVPELLTRYQTFISQKYGTIQNFNAKWGTAYASFQAIPLPSFNPTTSAFLGKEEQMVEYNYFREQFITQRDQEAAAAIHQSAPNHLVWAGALSACAGPSQLFEFLKLDQFTQYDMLSTGVYPSDYHEGGFIKRFQSILSYLRATRPYETFGRPANLSETGLGDELGGAHETDQQMADWNQTQWADMVGDGGTSMDLWDYITFAYPGFRTLSGTPDYNNTQFVNSGNFIGALAGVDVKFTPPTPEVLLLRNKAVNNSTRSTWLDLGNYFNIGDWLYQLHVPFDVRTEADIDQTILNKYKVIVLCNQTALYDDAIYALLRSWADGQAGRVLVGGIYSAQDARFRPKSRCADMKYLMGIPSDAYSAPWHGTTGDPLQFVFKKPFGTLAQDARVSFTLCANSWDIPKPLAATAEVIAEISDKPGTPLLVRNTLPGGSKVFTFGMPPGLVWWSAEGEPGPVAHDGMVPIYRQMLAEAGVSPAFEAPTSLGVYVTSDKSGILFKERYAEPTDAIFTGDMGGAVYDTASCDVDPTGIVTLHASVPAHGFLVAKRLPISLAPQAGVTHISGVSSSQDHAAFTLSGTSPCNVTLSSLTPSTLFKLTFAGGGSSMVSSNAGGSATFTVPSGAQTLSLAPFPAPTGEVWVDFLWSGTELGTQAQPYNTLAEGVAAVLSSGTVHLVGPRSSSEHPRITKPLHLQAVGGQARIG